MAETEQLKEQVQVEVVEEQHEGGNGGNKEEMKPWEQHSAVISIPRFDYNAPSSLLQHSHSGFLITCPIKREKSATKEAISILGQYLGSDGTGCLKECDASDNVKRRKLCSVEEEIADATKSELPNYESTSSEIAESSIKETSNVVLVKVTRSGLVLFTFRKGSSSDPVRIVSLVNQSLESGSLKRPQWCHRIFPIQATCRLNEQEVRTTVSNLVLKYVDDKSNKLTRPVKFAVGYNRRGIEETEMKGVQGNSSDPRFCPLLDRSKCFSTVAAAVKEVVLDSSVDLKTPELCVLVELLPISGVPNGSLIAAISVLHRDLFDTKPRLNVKALGTDAKTK